MITLKEVTATQLSIIIFGVGTAGEALYYACLEAGIPVDAFCDNNRDKAAQKLFGLEIIHADRLSERFTDAVFLVSAAAIEDVVPQLERLGFHKWYPGGELLKSFHLAGHDYTKRMDLVAHAVEAMSFCHHNYLTPGKIYMRSVDLEVTEQCSMKCADCSNLMQYYQAPQNFNLETLMGWVEALCRNVDEIGEIRVIGGEPFMNKDCDRVVELLAQKPQIAKIAIYTNATIPLKQQQLDRLNHKKVIFMITDYEALSRNHGRIIEALEANGIRYSSRKPEDWTDCAKIERHHRTNQQQEELFRDCCANKLYTVIAGRFYRCPFVANAIQLQAVPDFPEDHVDLMKDDVRQELNNYIFHTKFLQACDWCNGRKISDPHIVPAAQVKKPMLYSIAT
jgi:organic radical activating enzyme